MINILKLIKNKALVKTFITFISGYFFLYFGCVLVPYLIEKDSISTTQIVFLLFAGFFVILIGIITPFLRKIKFSIDGFSTILIVLVSSIPLLILYLLLRLVLIGKVTKFKYKYFNFTASVASTFLGAPVIYRGKSNPKAKILIYNHTGPWEYLGAILALGGGPFNVVAGINLANTKIGTIFDKFLAWTIGFMVKKYSISVDRNSINSKLEVIDKMKEELALGKRIGIFPEGGRLTKQEILNGAILKGFKSGAFRVAWETKSPIQPVIFDFPAIWKAKDDDFWGVSPCLVYIRYLPLVDPVKFSSREEFQEKCRSMMEDKIRESKQLKKFLRSN